MAKTVLVVDDNSIVRQLICEVFTAAKDFEVCGQAENGKEAVEKARRLRPDLIVMDLSMPIMNGLEAARGIRQLLPVVRIIMFSEYCDAFEEQQARDAGISALVPKSRSASSLLTEARRLFTEDAA